MVSTWLAYLGPPVVAEAFFRPGHDGTGRARSRAKMKNEDNRTKHESCIDLRSAQMTPDLLRMQILRFG